MMTQNAAFLPMTNNPLAAASPNGVPWNQVGALPVQSLGGEINTLLSNNVITTQITPDFDLKIDLPLLQLRQPIHRALSSRAGYPMTEPALSPQA